MAPVLTAARLNELALLADRARDAVSGEPETRAEADALGELAYRAGKLARAAARPPCIGLFGPSQAGKSFLVGALLSYELGHLQVLSSGPAGTKKLDFLREVNPAKGVESTGVVTRFSTGPAPLPLTRGDFACRLLTAEALLASIATGFLVECTSPAPSSTRVSECLQRARTATGAPASALHRQAWETTWQLLGKKYGDRHAYLAELRRDPTLGAGAWKNDILTIAGWREVYSLLWGGRGHAPDLDALMNVLFDGLEATGHNESIEVLEADVRAAAGATSLLDAACLNSIGQAGARPIRFFLAGEARGREVSLPPPVLSALVSEIRLPLERRPGSLLDKADLLDFPGGRALKGINGFGKEELSTGRLELAVEVFKRGKLTFLFEQFALDREITTLLLCSPGPTKPEAIQLQSQVEQWLKIRYGAPVPAAAGELDKPSLFLALTKFDTSLGTLRSDNARDRWESRVQEACVDFWARTSSSWIHNWGAKARPFTNLFWIRNPYADQMQTVKSGTPDHATIHRGYLEARAVDRHVAAKESKWAAVDGEDDKGLPKSGVPLLSAALHDKLAEDVKGAELAQEGEAIARELTGVLRALAPSASDEEARARAQASAEALVAAVEKEMARAVSGEPFGEMIRLLTPPLREVQSEVAAAWRTIAPMSIKTSDKAKKLLVHLLKWWSAEAGARARSSDRGFPPALLESFARQVCVGKGLLPVLGASVFPYFSRANLDVSLVARICHVKIGDALLNLGQPRPRATPVGPIRLSYDESAHAEAGAIDWNDVSWGDDEAGASGTSASAPTLDLVFAGSRAFAGWKESLVPFYLASAGGSASSALSGPKAEALSTILRDLEAAR
jgi:hypothetical protein